MVISLLALTLHDSVSWHNIPILVAIGGSYWLGFAYNDYQDAAYDALDEHKKQGNFFAGNQVPKKWLLFAAIILCCAFLVGAWAFFGLKGIVVVLISFPVIWAYSGYPLRLKSRAGIDLLIHAFFVESYPYLVTLLLLGASWSRLDVVLIVIFLIGSLSAQLEQQLVDYDLDAKTEPNFTTWFGPNQTMTMLRLLTLVLALIGTLFAFQGIIPRFMIPFGLIAAPMLAHRFLRKPGQRKPKIVKIGTMMSGLVYGWVVMMFFFVT
jgi:4-hydroxybenzoate polyprenyltransferase